MHGYRRPGDHSAAGHLQILTRRQLDLRSIIQKFLLRSVVIFLPSVVGEGSDIVENEAIVLRIELRRSFRISRAPRHTKSVDELAKRGVVGGLLLRPRSDESQ